MIPHPPSNSTKDLVSMSEMTNTTSATREVASSTCNEHADAEQEVTATVVTWLGAKIFITVQRYLVVLLDYNSYSKITIE